MNSNNLNRLFHSLVEVFHDGYRLKDLQSDILAGMVVSLVAIPLGMALAIATGVPPQAGLYTIIVAGSLVALLGGCRFQVTGPTAAFVVVLAPIVQNFGFGGLLVAGAMSGIMVMALGFSGLGRWIRFIPHSVITAFTTGIAVVIATMQLKDFFGLPIERLPESYFGKIKDVLWFLPSASFPETMMGLLTLLLLFLIPKLTKKVPAPLIALAVVACIASWVDDTFGVPIATIQSRFGGIPAEFPEFTWPWKHLRSFSDIQNLLGPAFSIAMLGAIETLLSASVSDSLTDTKHDPDSELIALGLGNVFAPFWGGIPATGAIARTATNIGYGAKSPLAAFFHAVFTLLIVLFFSGYVSKIPMAALSALLLFVAYKISDIRHFFYMIKVAPRDDVIVLVLCFLLTVVFDMVAGVTFGLLAACLLIVRKTSEQFKLDIYHEEKPHHRWTKLPAHVGVIDIDGPMFFGASDRMAEAIVSIAASKEVLVFDFEGVPHVDVSALIALESLVKKLSRLQIKIAIFAPHKDSLALLQKSKIISKNNDIQIFSNHSQVDQWIQSIGTREN